MTLQVGDEVIIRSHVTGPNGASYRPPRSGQIGKVVAIDDGNGSDMKHTVAFTQRFKYAPDELLGFQHDG